MISQAARDAARYNDSGNLGAARLPDLSSVNDNREILLSLYRWTEGAAISTLEWYFNEKVSKARLSRLVRALAVFFIATGSLAPLIAVGTDQTFYAFWGYPIIGLGAICVGLDRVFGFSSSWMRYLSSAMSLQRLLLDFQIRWARFVVEISDSSITPDEFATGIEEIRRFGDQLSSVVASETQTWIEEFRGHITTLETQASATT